MAIVYSEFSRTSSDDDLDRCIRIGDQVRVSADQLEGAVTSTAGGSVVVSLPIDAPRGALEVAIAGLVQRHRRAVVVPSTPDGSPPEWWVVDLLVAAGATVAVDLHLLRWHDATGLWWTTDDGPLRMPLPLTDPATARNAAQVLVAARGLRAQSKEGALLAQVAGGAATLTREQWDALLAAQYLRMTRRRARRGGPTLGPRRESNGV